MRESRRKTPILERRTLRRLRWMAGVALFAACAAVAGPTNKMEVARLRSGCELDYPPFCIVHEDGRADGFSVELMRATLSAMGREVNFSTGPWAKVKGWLEAGTVDALPLVGRTPEREAIFDFTIPYVTMHGAIVVRADATDVHNLDDLHGRRVATMHGDNAEEFLRRVPRGFDILAFPTFTDALSALSTGDCDAVVVQRLVGLRLLSESSLENLRIVPRPVEGFVQEFCFAVKEGDRDTLALLNEGLALVIADGTHRRLHSKWFAALELPSDRPIVIGGDDNYPPFEFLDEKGRATGYNVELVRAIAEAVGMDVEIRLGRWSEIVHDLELGEIDGIEGMFYSPERDRLFDFSQAHTVNHCVSVVRRGSGPPPEDVKALSGLSLVVQDDDIMHEFARQNELTNRLTVVPSQEAALRAVSEGRQDCALVARMTALYWIEKLRLDDLAVGRTPLLSPEYCFAVPNGSKAMLAQLSEGLKMLEQNGEYRRVHDRWMGAYTEGRPTVRAVLGYLAIIVIPLLFVLALVLLWSWTLRRQVGKQTTDLRIERARLRRAQRVAHIDIGDWEFDLAKGTVDASDEARRIYGLGDRTWTINEVQQLPLAEHREQLDLALRALVERGEAYDVTFRIRRPSDGALVAIHSVAEYDATRDLVFGVIQDVTQQRQAEAKLAGSERKYRLIAENTIDCIWVMNMDLAFTYVNPAVRLLFGFTPDEFVGSRLPDHCDEAHFQQMAALIQEKAALPSEAAQAVFETVLFHKDGRPVPVEIHGNVIFDSEGRPCGLQGVTRDISERKRSEQALSVAADRVNAAVNAGNVGLWDWDLASNRVRYSAEWKRQIGYGEDEIGDSFTEWESRVHPDDLTPTVGQVRKALADRSQDYTVEFRLRHKDGSYRWILARASVQCDDAGRPACVIGAHVDITERKQIEEDARRQQALLDRIFDVLPIGLWFADKDGTLLRGNPAGVKIWGAEPHVPISEYGIFKAWHLPTREPVEPEDWALAKTIREGITITDELLEIEAFDGKRKTILNYTVPILDESGSIEGAIVMNLDISDRVALESQLAQSQKLESIGRLAGGVAHDFNNLLMGIMNYVELCRDGIDPDHPIREWLDEVTHDAERSAALVRQLLAFARKQTIAPKVLDLNDSVAGMLKMLQRLIGEDINLLWQPGAGVPPVKMDPAQLDQILANLCVNARDAIEGVGKITIETAVSTITPEYCTEHAEAIEGNFVVLAVSDDGCGMDAETRANIFEPFFTTKGVGEGTGLGLATIYGIVKQNGGFVNVYSEPGHGSIFRIYLPRCEEEAPGEAVSTDGALRVGGHETILLVEDEKSVRLTTGIFLQDLGYTVLAAENPEEALRLAEGHDAEVHLVITDIVMPGMNGRDLADRLLELRPAIKRLLISGFTADVIAQRGILDDGVDFLSKPFGRDALARKVREVLEGV